MMTGRSLCIRQRVCAALSVVMSFFELLPCRRTAVFCLVKFHECSTNYVIVCIPNEALHACVGC